MKKIVLSFTLAFSFLVANSESPKYIFYFIGDGMGVNHVALTCAAEAAKEGEIGFQKLSFTDFPVIGYAKTNAKTRLTTCSAAAGTALATGTKTSIGTIGMDVIREQNLYSVAVDAKNSGKKVGIVTTVSIDHATAAAFYAHAKSRSDYDVIASWIPKTGFDLYAGSGFLKISSNFYDSLKKHCGYNVVRGNDAKLNGNKVVWIEKEGKKTDALTLAIDRKDEDMKLSEIVEKSIDFLDNKNGFFIMAEGGQIDWAAHANDAASIVYETLDLSDAVSEALEFYKKHPQETLIIVTADHETGGLSLGRGDRNYDTNFEKLYTQGGSKGVVGGEKCAQINKEAGVGFTSAAHTSAFVPVYAIGVGSERFLGELDNTDIANIIRELIK